MSGGIAGTAQRQEATKQRRAIPPCMGGHNWTSAAAAQRQYRTAARTTAQRQQLRNCGNWRTAGWDLKIVGLRANGERRQWRNGMHANGNAATGEQMRNPTGGQNCRTERTADCARAANGIAGCGR